MLTRWFLSCIGLMGCFCQAVAQASVVLNWARTDTTPGSQSHVYNRVASQPNGNFVVVGYTAVTTNGTRRALVRSIRPNGTLAWERTFAGPALTPSLQADQVLSLSDSSVIVTLVGDSSQYFRLNGLTGSTMAIRTIPNKSDGSFINSDASAYFYKMKTEPYTELTADTTFYGESHTLDFYRVANTLAVTQGTALLGIDGTKTFTFLGLNVTTDFFNPFVRCLSAPDAFFLTMSARKTTSDQFTPIEGDSIVALVVKFSPAGVEQWRSSREGEVIEFFPGQSWVQPTQMSEGELGRTFEGHVCFNYVWSTENPLTYHQRAIIFDGATGGSSLQSPRSEHHTSVLQNSFVYQWLDYNSFKGWAKRDTQGAFIWGRYGDLASRLPFQTTTYDLSTAGAPSILLKRFRDDASATLIDSTTLPVAPTFLTQAVENQTSGDGMIIGNQITNGAGGGWIARYSQAPSAVGNTYTVPRNQVLNGASVLANDRFPLGALSQVETPARNGRLEFNSDGTFRYTPRAGYAGSDSFVYSIYRPGILVFSRATVFITVTP